MTHVPLGQCGQWWIITTMVIYTYIVDKIRHLTIRELLLSKLTVFWWSLSTMNVDHVNGLPLFSTTMSLYPVT